MKLPSLFDVVAASAEEFEIAVAARDAKDDGREDDFIEDTLATLSVEDRDEDAAVAESTDVDNEEEQVDGM